MAYTAIDDGTSFFHTQLYTGTGANQDVVNDAHSGNFKPDFLIIKNIGSGSYGPHLYDSMRGVSDKRYAFHIDQNYGDDQEQTSSGTVVQTFDTDGFRAGSSTNIYNILWINGLNNNYIAHQWKINGGTTSSLSNTGPDSVVQINTTMGVNILTYTGNGSNSNVKHGMGEIPDMLWVKRRNGGDSSWAVWHKDLVTPAANFLKLDATDAEASGVWDGVHPSDEKFFISGGSSYTNVSGSDYVAYIFKSKQGFSKFSKYTGNGHSEGLGPFVYTGFAPALVIIKRIDSTQDWIVHDYKLGTKASTGSSKGNKGNVNSAAYRLNNTSAIDDWGDIDMLSTGFIPRSDAASINASNGKYIYMAFAEHPLVTSTGIPTTAR